jgi:hypothetical protein
MVRSGFGAKKIDDELVLLSVAQSEYHISKKIKSSLAPNNTRK